MWIAVLRGRIPFSFVNIYLSFLKVILLLSAPRSVAERETFLSLEALASATLALF